MKYIKQFGIIIVVTCLGELAKLFIPLPVPASIYGMLFLLAALCTGCVKLEQVEGAGDFLVEIMPLMFIPAGAGLLESFGILKSVLVPVTVIVAVTTVAVMGISGRVTQAVIRRKGGDKDGSDCK